MDEVITCFEPVKKISRAKNDFVSKNLGNTDGSEKLNIIISALFSFFVSEIQFLIFSFLLNADKECIDVFFNTLSERLDLSKDMILSSFKNKVN